MESSVAFLGERPPHAYALQGGAHGLLPPDAQRRALPRRGVLTGAAFMRALVGAGDLIPAWRVAARWGMSSQELADAEMQQALFSLQVDDVDVVPAEWMALARAQVTDICLALRGRSPDTKLCFWKGRHAGLNGQTIPEFLEAMHGSPAALAAVVELAGQIHPRSSHGRETS